MIRTQDQADGQRHVAVLYENAAWLDDFFGALERRGVPFGAIRLDDAAMLLDEPPDCPVVFNRVSPSSYLRGHGPAIAYARALLDVLDAHGCRLINGPRAFAVETSKVAQLLLLRRLGVAAPRTVIFNSRRRVRDAARAFPFPAILKPDCGGSGAFIRRVESRDHLLAVLDEAEGLFGPDHLLLLQEALGDAAAVVRTEFIDGELVCAMRVRAVNTFNLCPAESCERPPADPADAEPPRVEFEAYPDIPPEAVAQAREIVRLAHLDVGGVEYFESPEGTRWFFDINATSVYRHDVCRRLGVDAAGKLVDFVEREYRKEIDKYPRTAASLRPMRAHVRMPRRALGR